MFHLLSGVLTLVISIGTFASIRPECGTSDARKWMSFSESIIGLDQYKFSNSHPRLRKLEEVVVRNALITASYAGLYREERERYGENQLSQYLWLPAAAFASFEVGQVMRHGYLKLKNKLKVTGTLHPETYWENPLKEIFVVGNLTFTAEQVAQYLGDGNHGVYKDLYWQHLVTVKCGVDDTIRLLVNLQNRASTDKERNHYRLHEKGWRTLKAGLESLDFDTLEHANLKFLFVEQSLVLQPLIYDGPLGQLGGTLFAQLAGSPVRDENFSSQSFRMYCRTHYKIPNFSHFKTRWAWMTEQLHEMYQFFNGPYAYRVKEHHMFFIKDSRNLIVRN